MRPWKNLTSKIKWHKEAVAKRCSVKKMLLEISKNPQENTCARASYLIMLTRLWHRYFPVNFFEISRNYFSDETPLVDASGLTCKVNSSNLSIQDLPCLLISCWFFYLINIFFLRTVLFQQSFFLNFNHRYHFCVLKNLLYSFASMLFLKRAVKS